MERNLHDCLGVAKNLFVGGGRVVPGGGAVEMELGSRLTKSAENFSGIA